MVFSISKLTFRTIGKYTVKHVHLILITSIMQDEDTYKYFLNYYYYVQPSFLHYIDIKLSALDFKIHRFYNVYCLPKIPVFFVTFKA